MILLAVDCRINMEVLNKLLILLLTDGTLSLYWMDVKVKQEKVTSELDSTRFFSSNLHVAYYCMKNTDCWMVCKVGLSFQASTKLVEPEYYENEPGLTFQCWTKVASMNIFKQFTIYHFSISKFFTFKKYSFSIVNFN